MVVLSKLTKVRSPNKDSRHSGEIDIEIFNVLRPVKPERIFNIRSGQTDQGHIMSKQNYMLLPLRSIILLFHSF